MSGGAPLATAMLLSLVVGWPAQAQAPTPDTWLQPEIRLDVLGGRAPSVQGAVALSVPFGIYARSALALGVGPAWHDGAISVGSRIDGSIRFLLDPFRQQPWALYGLGGASVRHDSWEGWHPYLLVGLGVEGPERAGLVPAAELGLGGGVRVAVAFRRAIRERR